MTWIALGMRRNLPLTMSLAVLLSCAGAQPVAEVTQAPLADAAAADERCAQNGHRVEGRKAFDRGRELMRQGRWEEAIPYFECYDRSKPSVGARLNIAECHALLGRTASAWSMFHRARRLAAKKKDRKREGYARKRLRELKDSVSYATIDMPDARRPRGLVLREGRTAIEPGRWNRRRPIDPGTYSYKLSAPGYRPWTRQIVVGEVGQDFVIAPRIIRCSDDCDPLLPPTRQRNMALVTMGAGGAALAVGTVLSLQARARWGNATERCVHPPYICTAEAVTQGEEARRMADRASLVLGGGALLLASGALWWWLDRGKRHKQRSRKRLSTVQPLLRTGIWGLSVNTRF